MLVIIIQSDALSYLMAMKNWSIVYQWLAIFLCTLPLPVLAQLSAREVVKIADEKMRGKTTTSEMIVRIVRPTWQREMTMKSWTSGNKYAMILVESPARDRGTVFLKRGREVWNWIPAIERSIKLPPSMMNQSWMGTDFTNDDLVKEFSILEDYDHQFAPEASVDGRPCYVIILTPLPQAAVIWGKIRLWIDKKDFMQIQGEFYDETGELVNRMKSSDFKILGGKMLPARLEMIPVAKKGNMTVMIYEDLSFDQPIPESFFTTENMRKVK